MKNLSKFIGIIALVAVIMFSMTACPEDGGDSGDNSNNNGNNNGETGDPLDNLPVAERWTKQVAQASTATLEYSVANDGVCTITVGGVAVAEPMNIWHVNAQYRYTAAAGKSYTYVFEAWTESGTRDMVVQYYYDSDTGDSLYSAITINTTRQQYTVKGGHISKGGVRLLQFNCANQLGTFYVKVLSITEYNGETGDPLDNLPAAERWYKWVADDSTATLNFSVASDGVCTITVGGTADTNLWKAKAAYMYTGKANVNYTYKFEAWTPSSTRKLSVMYYAGTDDNPPEFLYLDRELNIDSTRKIFELRGASLPRAGERSLDFECADQLGTFYVKVLSITENTP